MAWAAPFTTMCGVMEWSPSGIGFLAFVMMTLLRPVRGGIRSSVRDSLRATIRGCVPGSAHGDYRAVTRSSTAFGEIVSPGVGPLSIRRHGAIGRQPLPHEPEA